MYTREIGERFTIESRGITLQVAEGRSCKNCYLWDDADGECERHFSDEVSKYVGACSKIWRNDKKDVIFKQVKESNTMNVDLCLEPATEQIKGYCFRELRKDGNQVIFREVPKVQTQFKK